MWVELNRVTHTHGVECRQQASPLKYIPVGTVLLSPSRIWSCRSWWTTYLKQTSWGIACISRHKLLSLAVWHSMFSRVAADTGSTCNKAVSWEYWLRAGRKAWSWASATHRPASAGCSEWLQCYPGEIGRDWSLTSQPGTAEIQVSQVLCVGPTWQPAPVESVKAGG